MAPWLKLRIPTGELRETKVESSRQQEEAIGRPTSPTGSGLNVILSQGCSPAT